MPPTGKPIEVHGSFRFKVEIDGISYAAFTECNLPSLQVDTQEVQEGGLNEYSHKLPVRVKTGSVTLKHGITKDGALLKWYMQVMNGEIADATRTVKVIMFDSRMKPVSTFTFREAYPVKWGGPQLKAGDQSLAIEELELVHHGFEVD
jgi:phage tail-like protein